MVYRMFSSKPCLIIIDYTLENDYWLLENDGKWLYYNQIIDSSWWFWLPEGNLINPEALNYQTSPPWGPSVRGSFPGSPVAAFSRGAFFSRAMQRHGGQVYRLDIWERRLVSWSPFRNLKVKACGYILLEHLRINLKKIPQKINSTLAAEGKSPA